MTETTPRPIDLALQGGGAHGAFTWGVLDRLLEDGRLTLDGLSGTSAGAMNAVVLADGLQKGGPDAARQALEDFWSAVSRAAAFSPLQRTALDMLMGRWTLDHSPAFQMFEMLSRQFSPYEFNPFDINPLRDLVGGLVDFGRVNACAPCRIFITATNVRTGRAKIFRQGDITLDAVMASACLPFLFRAVEIDGEAYWDGGYSGNPALFPLVDDCAARDIVLVQINPVARQPVPRTAREILNRMNEITFNASLIKELRQIALLKELIRQAGLESERHRDVLLHRIHADDDLSDLGVSSKMNAEWAFLLHLRDIGRRAAGFWLDRHIEDVGQRSSFDIHALFAESLRPLAAGDAMDGAEVTLPTAPPPGRRLPKAAQ